MQCPHCKLDAPLMRRSYSTEGDKSPDTPTRCFTTPQFVCVNPACTGYQKVFDGERLLLFDEGEANT